MAADNGLKKNDSKIEMFHFNLRTKKQQKEFAATFRKHNGDWQAIKTELKGREGFGDQLIGVLEFTHDLAAWSRGNSALVTAFQNDQQTNSLRDIALTLNKPAFIIRIEAAAPGNTEAEKRTYALNLRRDLFRREPSAMLVNMIKDPQLPFLSDAVGANIAAVLSKRPDFNIKTTSVYELVRNDDVFKDISADAQPAVKGGLKTLQRLAAVSSEPDAVPALYNAKIQSAMQIGALPKAQFVAALKDSDLDAQTLAQIHNNAQQTRARNESFLMSIREAAQPTHVALIDRSLNANVHLHAEAMQPVGVAVAEKSAQAYAQEKIAQHNLSWDLLFGDTDFCECGECNSVYSAAAYFVELLNYLRNNNLDPAASGPLSIKANPRDISGTPLEKLFDRRPDLGCLQLTCQNTNTLIPYVDLVNEVMENYVAFKKLKQFNVADETSSELLAEPQHTEYKAYCILKNEVYPFTLPYHQPIDAVRTYLEFLETSRHALIDTFRKSTLGTDAELSALKDEALDRAADAEFLGLTNEEYVILTKESFESIELMRKLKNNPALGAQEYWKMIGGKPVHEYYGYADAAMMLGGDGLTQIKREFLRRTGIDYLDLVDLLKTQTINPSLPRGRVKSITESLHFSYRFLQNYAKVHGLEAMAEFLVKGEKFAELLPALKDKVALLTDRKTLSCPAACDDDLDISDKDLICWVKCYFEKIGKMIVIESGRGCANGEIVAASNADAIAGKTYRIIAVVRDCEILINLGDRQTAVGSIEKLTGKITFVDAEADPEALKDYVFLGANGEKGIFLVKDGEVYLIYLEQKDSCNLDTALLQHLDGTSLTEAEYDRIHRFIRLWRKLNWTIAEIDHAIVGLSVADSESCPDGTAGETGATLCGDNSDECDECDECGCDNCGDCAQDLCRDIFDINPRLIHQLAAVVELIDRTGLELAMLLGFWTNIGTAGEQALYRRLFLTHNIISIDRGFKADTNGNYLTTSAKLSEHLPAVMAALNLSADDIQAIIASVGISDELTLGNLSLLYRYRLLSKVLGLHVPAFLAALPLFGDVFKDADATLEFMERWSRMDGAGFTYQQLNYIICDSDDARKPFVPNQKAVLLLSKNLYDGLNEIDKTHQDLAADPDIADAATRQFNIQQKASANLVRGKASLLFDVAIVDELIALLEGTSVYTTYAPKNLNVALADDATLKSKLVYDKTLGSVQITGILTDAEANDYRNLSGDLGWTNALKRIQRQQAKAFKEMLSGVFDGEKTRSSADKAALEAVLKAGDVRVAVEAIPDGDPDPNSAPQKRVAFLAIFLPYLRQQLTHRFVIDSLAAFANLEPAQTDLLVSSVLRQGAPAQPIYHVFEQIKDSAQPAAGNWSGFLITPADADVTFIARNSDVAPVVNIDGAALNFTVQEDSTNEWWSDTQHLTAGKLYKLTTTGVGLENLFWKTPASAISAIPSSALIPDFAPQQATPALAALVKAALLVTGFELSVDEIGFLDSHKAHFDGLDFNAFSLIHWLRLEAYTRLRNSLPQAAINFLNFLHWTNDAAADASELSAKIETITTWKKTRIDKLIASDHFNLAKPSDYCNEKYLLKLQKALQMADKIGIDIDLLFDWAVPTSHFQKTRTIADNIKKAIRARYNQTDWEQVVKPLNDTLRGHQRNALTAYLLQQSELIAWGVTDADGLFEYFLIDVQMDACMETSRIKQAISSVQLFIQRCFLGLEEEFSHIAPDILDRKRWDWMHRYRVWEANRKVFLYPENWIESNLRDDKSVFFKELESELLQKDINSQNVAEALKSYLYKVDEVSNMEVIGLYIDGTRTGTQWSEKARMHVFARTRNAPYVFYYRYLALDEMNWYPWDKMQIDIPSFDLENPSTHQVTGNGCYLAPVVWNGRLLVFFPQIMKKTRSATNGNKQVRAVADDTIQSALPVEYYEIRMAWSEYRNGKWTQKQLSNNVLSIDITTGRRIDLFSFVPDVSSSRVIVRVEDHTTDDMFTFKGFTFTGSKIEDDKDVGSVSSTLPTSINTEFGATAFQRNVNTNAVKSLQLSSNNWGNDDATFTVNQNKVQFNFDNSGVASRFYFAESNDLLKLANIGKLDAFFEHNLAMAANEFGCWSDGENHLYHELKQPYALYSWELFFHTPILLADALSKAQQFEEAMKWFHFVFNPIADGSDDSRFWQFKPFKDVDSKRILDSIFNSLKSNTAYAAINEWRDKPFMPHVVARSRPVAYMKWVVMKYVDNLLAWGDYLFRQDTIETINQASQLYVLAGHILGPKPMMIPKRGKVEPQTYLGLLDKWDAFGNAMVELELAAPSSNQTELPFAMVNGELAFANVYGTASAQYFCIPNNPKLMGYWDTVADRLYKIRHCLNIVGVFRKLPLFEPPIDPALLVKAAAQGLSIASVLNDLNTPMPNYRFYYLLQKSLELCNELKALGSAVLSALEKKDNETISLIRAKHESVMQNLVMEIKKKQLDEAQKNIESLQQNRKGPEARMKHYLKLSGLDESLIPNSATDFSEIANEIVTVDGDSGLKLIAYEKEDMDKTGQAQSKQQDAAQPEKLASIMHIIPSFGAKFQPLGVGGSISFGGSNLGAAFQAWAKFVQLDASELTYGAANAGKKAGFTRSLQERVFQANAAGYELKQIDKQILAQQIRIDMANQDIANQQKIIDNAVEVEDFLKNKYTNEELYTWMRGSLRTLYRQVYNLAYDLAKKAEKTYWFERGLTNANFIQSGYFDAGRDGLLAGEQLYVGLKQLEAAYQSERGYDYEITKHISLYQLDPLAIIQLRETGRCEFVLPEVLFDLDFPGHFKRRIKTLSLSMPCIVGPYTGINATLRLLENKFRNTAIGGKAYVENTDGTDGTDGRFSTSLIPISAVAVSSAQNDSGTFELSFKDERYLPFEGAGVVSKWHLELPSVRQFDYQSIADVFIHLRYIASEGGEHLKADAGKTVTNQLGLMRQSLNETGLHIPLDMQHDLPNEWNTFKSTGSVVLSIAKARLPYMAQLVKRTAIESVMFLARTAEAQSLVPIKVDDNVLALQKISKDLALCRGVSEGILLNKEFTLSAESQPLSAIQGLMIVVKYSVQN